MSRSIGSGSAGDASITNDLAQKRALNELTDPSCHRSSLGRLPVGVPWDDAAPRRAQAQSALRAELEGLVESLRLVRVLAGDPPVLGVGSDKRLRFTRF